VSEPAKTDWGFFRRPALLGPTVSFFVFLAAEAIRLRAQTSGSGESGDWIIWIGLFVFIANLFSAIPYLLGAFVLLAACRVLPRGLVQFTAFRVVLGGLVGGLIAWPFAHALNWIPSASVSEPRFNLLSVLIACAVGGGYCAVFFSEARSARSG
jgi:hypothetical protein